MKEVKTSKKGFDYITKILKDKKTVITRAFLWNIQHNSNITDISLKVGRYQKDKKGDEKLKKLKPKSELTLDNEEFMNLIDFLEKNYEPFKEGIKKYIPIGKDVSNDDIKYLKKFLEKKDHKELLRIINEESLMPDEILKGLEYSRKLRAIEKFENMLKENYKESRWQKWFENNQWVLGSEFVRIIDNRNIDTENIADYLMQAYDGFLDIIEIKRPSKRMNFWNSTKDHDNYIPSKKLIKAITQANKYIYEVEREANSIKFQEKINNIKVIKPRGILIFGRSKEWKKEQKEAYRILNSSYHNLTILTYDHVLDRAKRIVDYEKK